VTFRTAPHRARLVSLAAGLLGLGVIGGRVEIVAVGAAFALLLAARSSRRPAVPVQVDLRLSEDRCIEGEGVWVVVTLECARPVPAADVVLHLGPGLSVVKGEPRASVALSPGVPREIGVKVLPTRWGVHPVGPVSVTLVAQGRLLAGAVSAPAQPLRVLPRPEAFSASAAHPFMRELSGGHVSRRSGEGVEFAGVRAYATGDQLRRVNWKVTSRRGDLHVNEQHPERNAEVVLFVDTFVDPGPPGMTSLDVAVRAGVAIAEHYLAQTDRVGVVGFGGVLRWVPSGSGGVQRYRVVEHLLGTELVATYAWKDLTVIPRQSLPPRALIVALSPLLDERAVGALADLARRGFGVVVVDTSPEQLLHPPASTLSEVAQQLWFMEREAMLRRLGDIGVPVVRWLGAGSLDVVLGEVSRLHARPRLVSR